MEIGFSEAYSPEEKTDQIASFLKEMGVPIEEWTGKNATKTLEDLVKEIENGETQLRVDENGEVLREVNVAVFRIEAVDPSTGDRYVLNEAYQEFADGSVRQRAREGGGISEKIMATETPQQATERGILEELQISEGYEISDTVEATQDRFQSTSYPGLTATQNIFKTTVTFDSKHFEETKNTGYKEVQLDREGNLIKTTYFKWEKVQ